MEGLVRGLPGDWRKRLEPMRAYYLRDPHNDYRTPSESLVGLSRARSRRPPQTVDSLKGQMLELEQKIRSYEFTLQGEWRSQQREFIRMRLGPLRAELSKIQHAILKKGGALPKEEKRPVVAKSVINEAPVLPAAAQEPAASDVSFSVRLPSPSEQDPRAQAIRRAVHDGRSVTYTHSEYGTGEIQDVDTDLSKATVIFPEGKSIRVNLLLALKSITIGKLGQALISPPPKKKGSKKKSVAAAAELRPRKANDSESAWLTRLQSAIKNAAPMVAKIQRSASQLKTISSEGITELKALQRMIIDAKNEAARYKNPKLAGIVGKLHRLTRILEPISSSKIDFLSQLRPLQINLAALLQELTILTAKSPPEKNQESNENKGPEALMRYSWPGWLYTYGKLLQALGMERRGRQLIQRAAFKLAPQREVTHWVPVIEMAKAHLDSLLPAVGFASHAALTHSIFSPEIIRPHSDSQIRQLALGFARAHGSKALVNHKWVPLHRIQANGKTPFEQLVSFYEETAWEMIDIFFVVLKQSPSALKLAETAAYTICQELHEIHNRENLDNAEGIPIAMFKAAA
jgi:hypothetical protein